MGLFKKKFNAVAEGVSGEYLWRLALEKIRIEIPKEAGILYDSGNKYVLYGRINDAIIQKQEAGGIEAVINCALSFERKRAIIMRDGRIFLNESIEGRDEYIRNSLKSVTYKAKGMFEEGGFFKRVHERLRMR